MATDTLLTIEADDSAIVSGERPDFSGPFQVRLLNPSVADTQSGGKRVRFSLDVVDDPSGRNQEGCVILSGQNLPRGEKAHITRGFWLAMLESLGVTKPGKKFNLKLDDLENKVGYIVYTTPEDKGDEYGDVTWLTKARYEAAVARIKAQAEAGTLPTKQAETDGSDDFVLPEETAVEYDEQEVINL